MTNFVEPIGWTADSHIPPGYKLAFNDEFKGPTLNRDKWHTRYIYSNGTLDFLNDEQQRYRDNNNHVIKNEILNLVARKTDTGTGYESGMIRSKWTTLYGYFEAKIIMPSAKGVWPAFWLNSDVDPVSGRIGWPPEIDIFEFVVNGVEDNPAGKPQNMIHSGVVTRPTTPSTLLYKDPKYDTKWGNYYAPGDLTKGWHVYGCEWTKDYVAIFIDGVMIWKRTYDWVYPDSMKPAGPAHILLNLAIGGGWAGRHGIDDAAFPQSMQIAWVRGYTK